jgi:hypothetical protein
MWHVACVEKNRLYVHTALVRKMGRKGPLERLGCSTKEDGTAGTGLMRLKSEMNGGFL